jgi:hypothetical protein
MEVEKAVVSKNSRKICSEVGFKMYKSRKGDQKFELRFNLKGCKSTNEHRHIYDKLATDAMFHDHAIFSNQMVEGYQYDEMFKPSMKFSAGRLKYRSREDMVRDFLNVENYIRKNK